jgi:hypothetical protein
MNNKYILKLKDGGIKDIQQSKEYISGNCSTCDYGRSYINEITFYLKERKLNIKVSDTDEYPLSEGYIMKLLLNNVDYIKEMTEYDFFVWIDTNIKNECNEVEAYLN